MKHLSLADWGDIMVVAPATANILAKGALGIGDDLLSTVLLSFRKPVVFVPAMDEGMWLNPAVKRNVRILLASGCQVVDPAAGQLASGRSGKGRFPSIERTYKHVLTAAQGYKTLEGRRFLIAGGRTEEDIDSVRVVTNRSSGKMALELYDAVLCRGGAAKLIIGCPAVPVPDDGSVVSVRTSAEMLYMLKKNIRWCDCLIMAAAVGDYLPLKKHASKVHAASFKLPLFRNKDLLKELARFKKGRSFIGFSLEDRDELKRAGQKLRSKSLDHIVLNSPAAIGSDRTKARIMARNGRVVDYGTLSKWELANRIVDLCVPKGRT
jgi:phosphopantothenoylcysteine decarboxylase/phosphopantothenate--cysteine ligase